MGTHISRVKSVDLDAWTDEQMQNVLKWGNARANKLVSLGLVWLYFADLVQVLGGEACAWSYSFRSVSWWRTEALCSILANCCSMQEDRELYSHQVRIQAMGDGWTCAGSFDAG